MLSKVLGSLSTVQIGFFTRFRGTLVGQDEQGNRYYRGKPIGGRTRERRWVIYKGEAEASRVPPEWHGWLHHQTDQLPAADNPLRRPWQKPHQPNRTGTAGAYRPAGHTLAAGRHAPAADDYQAWTPES